MRHSCLDVSHVDAVGGGSACFIHATCFKAWTKKSKSNQHLLPSLLDMLVRRRRTDLGKAVACAATAFG